MPRKQSKEAKPKSSTQTRFLDASTVDWEAAHKDKQAEYFRQVTSQIVCKFLPIKELSPLTLKALAAIISEHVFGELLTYLSKQTNLLRIVIILLADDYNTLLQTAEAPTPAVAGTAGVQTAAATSMAEVCSAFVTATTEAHAKSSHVVQPLPSTASGSPRLKELPSQFDKHSVVFALNPADMVESEEEFYEAPDDQLSVVGKDTNHVVKDDPSSDENATKSSASSAANSGDEFVSEDLMNYFKVAPSNRNTTEGRLIASVGASPGQSPPNAATRAESTSPALSIATTDSASSGQIIKPTSIPAMTMMAAVSSEPEQNLEEGHAKLKVVPMASLTAAIPIASQEPMVDGRRQSVPMNGTTPAIPVTTLAGDRNQLSHKQGLRRGSSLDDQSLDSGLSLGIKEELSVKYRTIGVPTTTSRTERRRSAKYTLYVITYQGVYRNENDSGTHAKECQVFRRYREFISLRARLEKSARYHKALKAVSSPSWWDQVSLKPLGTHEVEKRRAGLEKFLRGLVCQPLIHASKDLEEFLAYYGGAEIEFVQEKIEFIPQAARLDKVVIRTVSGVLDKVSDKLSSQSSYASLEGRKHLDATDHRKSKGSAAEVHEKDNSKIFSTTESVESDLLPIMNEPEVLNTLQPEFSLEQQTVIKASTREHRFSSHLLADAIFEILLLLLQDHLDSSKSSRIVTAVRSLLVPYLSHWLRNKLNIYSSPQELSRLLALFRETIWPDEEEVEKSYDIDSLKRLAAECVLEEVPSPVTAVLETEIRKLMKDVLEITEAKETNEQLCYTLVSQLLNNSLSVLIS